MRSSTRTDKLLPAGVLALCATVFAAGGRAQTSAEEIVRSPDDPADPCRNCGPGGPDLCVTITYPDGSRLTCYEVRSTRIRDGSADTLEETESDARSGH